MHQTIPQPSQSQNWKCVRNVIILPYFNESATVLFLQECVTEDVVLNVRSTLTVLLINTVDGRMHPSYSTNVQIRSVKAGAVWTLPVYPMTVNGTCAAKSARYLILKMTDQTTTNPHSIFL